MSDQDTLIKNLNFGFCRTLGKKLEDFEIKQEVRFYE